MVTEYILAASGYPFDDRDAADFKRRILSRSASKVHFVQTRSTSVKQSLREFLERIGTVRIGAGAADDHEVCLYRVPSLRRLERALQRRYAPILDSLAGGTTH